MIEPAPKWAPHVMEYELSQREDTRKEAVYRLSLDGLHDFGGYFFTNAAEYIDVVEDKSNFHYYYRAFHRYDDETFDEIRKKWTDREERGLRNMTLWKITDWLSLPLVLIFLGFSVFWFHQWRSGARGIQWLLFSFSGQVIILLLGAYSFLFWSNLFIVWMAFLVPVIVVYEIVFYLVSWYRRRQV